MSDRGLNGKINAEDAEEFSDALGGIVHGALRLMEWGNEQGIPDALGLTSEEWALRKLSGHPRLSIEDRRKVVTALADEGMSQREIAAVVGVSHPTVGTDLKASGKNLPPALEESAASQEHVEDVGKNLPLPDDHAPDPPLLSVVDLETGEVVDPEPDEAAPDMAETAYAIADDAGKADIDRANFLHALSKSIGRISSIPAEWDAETVAEVIDPELKKSIDINVTNLARWAKRIEDAMPRGLRMVKRETA